MIKINNVDVYGFEAAIRGMRNSHNSWDASDSVFNDEEVSIGDLDYRLMENLAGLGPSHAKFRRFVTVTMDITAPLYWWKQFDTYKVGCDCLSTSTMHTITKEPFTKDDFSHEFIEKLRYTNSLDTVVAVLNYLRENYLSLGKQGKIQEQKDTFYTIIELLPESYMQKRTVKMNFETLYNIISQRQHHKLKEWRDFCEFIKTNIPYSRLIFVNNK